MKRLKLLSIIVLSLAFILNIGTVKATDLLEDDAAIVTSIELKQLKTGTGPWDDNDEAGNDSSANNLIVRSFDQVTWTIENTMEITNDAEKYTGGRLYFEVTIPDEFTSETFKWDLDSMNWIEEPQVSSDGMTLTGYYSMKTTDTTVPGKQNLIFTGKVLGARNGTVLDPIFKTWLNGNTEDEYCTAKFDKITVSSTPNYNVKIARNGSCANRTTITLDGAEVSGRMFGYVVIFQLYNTSASKGMKGVEYPTGEFLTDIKLNLYKKVNGVNEDISEEVTPILWQYYIAGTGGTAGAGFIEGREIYKGNSGYVYNGSNLTPNGYLTSNRDNCIFDSGTPTMTQEDNTIHLSIKDYKFDGIFPRVTRDGNANTATVYPANVGCFSSIQFQVFVPDFDTYDSTGTYYLYVTDENMQATSLSNITSNTQNATNDDSTNVQYMQYKTGSYSNYIHLVKRKDKNFWISYCSSGWGAGDSRVYRGQEISICPQFTQSESNDEENKIQSINNLLKFDGDCYDPVVLSDGTAFQVSPNEMTFKIWYATKKDGTNWNSQTEMNKATLDDMTLYKTLDEIPDEYTCTGIYMESTGGIMNSTSSMLRIPFVIKETANINQTYGVTQIPVYYTEPLDRSIYTIDNPDVVWPTNYVYRSQRDYVKSEFDEAGAIITGTHYNGISWGNTAQVVGAEQAISIVAIDPTTQENKINYDMSKNEYDVTYKMSPVLKNTIDTVNFGESDVTVDVIAKLPSSMSYVAGSSNYGDPELTLNPDGTTTLTWTIYNCTVNETIEPIIFKGHINEESTNGEQITVNAEIDADTTKIGTTRPAVRVAQTTVQVIDLAAHRLYKTVKTPVIEQNGEIHYTVSYKNNTDSIIEDFQLLDILPYNGDSRGTDYTGSMQITRLVITQKDQNGNVLSSNDNLRLYYTSDESAKEATAKDQNLGEGWTLATSENIMSSLTAFAVKGTVGSQGLVTVDIYIKTNGNKSEDKYVNSASTQVYATTNAIITSDVTAHVVSRMIEGIVWYDLNNDGIMDDNEPKASNIKLTLTDSQGNSVTDVDENVVSDVFTDENGYYTFSNLKAYDYYVKIAMPNPTYSITEKNVGAKATVNSKFNQDTQETDLITKLNSVTLPNLVVSNQNAGLVKKPTQVVVMYKEVGTEEILADTETIEGRADDPYTTVNKLDEINEENNNKYNFVRVDGDAEGTMESDTIYITYWYQKKPTNILVKYIDIDTNEEIYDEYIEYGNIDQEYTTINQLDNINKKYGNIYDFVRVDGDAQGTMEANQKVITYFYQKKDGEIEVNYLEYGTNIVLAEKINSTEKIGTPYETIDKIDEINNNSNYVYELISINGAKTGEYKLEKQVITYYYAKKGSKVVTKYVDIDTNEEIYDLDVNVGAIGQEYSTINQIDNINKKYDGVYTFVKVDGNTSGNMTENTIFVTYYYQKGMGEIEVNYVEVDTNEVLAKQITSIGRIGTGYETQDKVQEINDTHEYVYELVKVEGNAVGNYSKEKQVITYYYKKSMSKIIVKFVSEDTQEELAESEEYTDYVGKEYSTNPKDIEGWKLVESKIPYNKNGKYQKDIIEVIYYYNKIDNTQENTNTSDINVILLTIVMIISICGIVRFKKICK